jgi:hypothetical protein
MARAAVDRQGVLVVVVVAALLVGCATTEPAIPTCSGCELRLPLFGSTGRVRGTFSGVDTTVFKAARVESTSGTTVVTMPVNGPYDQPFGVSSPRPTTAEMRWQYKTSFGDLRWTSTTQTLTVVPPIKSVGTVNSFGAPGS